MIIFNKHQTQQGSVILVALCCVAVLGIALGSYLAVSNQAVKLSNRSYQQSVSRQLAETGLEQTLWAFDRNNWDPAVWTITGTTATRTITFPNTKYGNGVTGSINLRVDNYNAYYRSSTWSAAASYRIGDLVGYTDGMWYRCLRSHSNITPGNLSYWVPAPIPWMWSSNIAYKAGAGTMNASIVYHGSNWYLCNTDHTSGTSFIANATNWTLIPTPSFSWDSSANYALDAFVYSGGTWYRCIAAHTNQSPPNPSYWSTGAPNISWAYRSGATYNFNDLVFYSASGVGTWYRCTSSSPGAPPSGWERAVNDSWAWSSSISYNLNDVVYNGSSFYRCILAHTNQAPPNATYWSSAPLLSPGWDAGRQYSINDTVNYNGSWYLCLQSNSGKIPSIYSDSLSSYWALAPQSLTAWDSTKKYGINDTVSYSGSWYRCLAAHLNQPPTNASFWTSTTGASQQWDATTPYTTTSYVSYGGVWYHCVLGHTNQTPNNATYWTALGAPVIYAEGVTTLPDGSSAIKIQLRATIAKAPLFPNAAAATSTLTLSSTGTVDSYDGTVYGKTSAGAESAYLYDQPSPLQPPFGNSTPFAKNNISYSAVLASTSTSSPAITITNATIKGYVAALSSTSAPYAPLWAYSGSAILTGTVSGTGIDLTRVSRSPSIPQFETLPSGGLAAAFTALNFPKGTALPTSDTIINIGTPGAVTPSRYYYNGNLTLGLPPPFRTLNINGPVILYINGDLRMVGDSSPPPSLVNGAIIISSTGSAEIHVAGGFKVDGASEGITNNSTNPKTLIIICDTTASTTHYYNEGVNPFYGVLYAPNSTAVQFTNLNTTTYGAISAKKIDFTVQATLHYDTSLRYATFGGIDTPFSITESRELTDQTERITLP